MDIENILGIGILVVVGTLAVVVLSLPIHFMFFLIRLVKVRHNPEGKKIKASAIVIHTITVVLILILTAISIPYFLRLNAKATQSEAKTNLGVIYRSQLEYFSRTNTYASGEKAFEILNWNPPGQNRYAYYCDTAVIANKLPIGSGGMPLPDEDWPVELKPQSSQTGFTCMAVGNIDNDWMLDVWSINDAKVLRNDQDDVWGQKDLGTTR